MSPLQALPSISPAESTALMAQKPSLSILTALMHSLDKAETHLHLGGSWPLSYLLEIADPQSFLELCHKLEQFQLGVDYHAGFEVFALIGKIVDTEEKVENGVVALCRELAQDNVTVVELRTGLKDLGGGLEGYLQSVLRGLRKGEQVAQLKTGLILSLRRETDVKTAAETIDLAIKYRAQGICGIDLSGDSTVGDGAGIHKALQMAKEAGFPITLHLGESPKETPEQQMAELQALQPHRIGHGVHLCKAARQWIEEKRIPLELCLSSAVMVKMVEKAEDHPGLALLKRNHPVLIDRKSVV